MRIYDLTYGASEEGAVTSLDEDPYKFRRWEGPLPESYVGVVCYTVSKDAKARKFSLNYIWSGITGNLDD